MQKDSASYGGQIILALKDHLGDLDRKQLDLLRLTEHDRAVFCATSISVVPALEHAYMPGNLATCTFIIADKNSGVHNDDYIAEVLNCTGRRICHQRDLLRMESEQFRRDEDMRNGLASAVDLMGMPHTRRMYAALTNLSNDVESNPALSRRNFFRRAGVSVTNALQVDKTMTPVFDRIEFDPESFGHRILHLPQHIAALNAEKAESKGGFFQRVMRGRLFGENRAGMDNGRIASVSDFKNYLSPNF